MPFTFSHPAAILPLTYLPKRWFSVTGLVIGSLTPDFEYFIRMRVYSSFSHTWAGMFWFDIPLAIFLAFLFHFCVRDKLIDSLPNYFQKRLLAYKGFEWMAYFKMKVLIIIFSCLIGTVTHLLWDGFTHQHGHFVQTISSLQESIFISGYSMPIYNLLQHTSSLLGIVLIIYALWKLPIHSTKSQGINWNYWIITALITVLAVMLRALISGNVAFGNIIVSAITGLMLGLIFTPAILLRRYKGR